MKKITPILFVLVLLLALTSCDDGVQFCTVTFKAEDGSTYLTQTVAKNAKVSNIEGPKKEGTWSFDCWLEVILSPKKHLCFAGEHQARFAI